MDIEGPLSRPAATPYMNPEKIPVTRKNLLTSQQKQLSHVILNVCDSPGRVMLPSKGILKKMKASSDQDLNTIEKLNSSVEIKEMLDHITLILDKITDHETLVRSESLFSRENVFSRNLFDTPQSTSSAAAAASINAVAMPAFSRERFFTDSTLDATESSTKTSNSYENDFPRKKVWFFAVSQIKEKEDVALYRLGMLITLLDLSDVNFNTFDLENDLEKEFELHLQKIRKKIIEEPDKLILRSGIAKSLANLLLSSRGYVNFGIIPKIQELFGSVSQENSGYTLNIMNFLETLRTDTTLRDKIASIPRPKKDNRIGKDIISISLKLLPHTKITSRDAKMTVLIACLSYPRQEHVANCFALSLVISLFSSSINKCIQEFREILEYGHLMRTLDGQKVYFPGLLKQPLDTIHTSLGIPSSEWHNDARVKELLKYLDKKFPTLTYPINTISELLEYYDTKTRNKGIVFWESRAKNLLTTVWSNIIASMAEGRNDGLIKSALIGSCILSAKKKGISESDAALFKSEIASRAHFHYDPTIHSKKDKFSNGAFVLYDRRRNYKKIDNYEKFQHFISTCLAPGELAKWFKTNEGLYAILQQFSDQGQEMVSNNRSIEGVQSLDHTPWVTRLGNDPIELLRNYKGSLINDPTISFRPETTLKLFNKVVEYTREYNKKNTYKRRSTNLIMIPVRIQGKHFFNLLMNHPSLLRCIEPGSLAPEEIVFQEMKQLAIDTASSLLPFSSRDQMMSFIKNEDIKLAEVISKMIIQEESPITIASFRKILIAFIPSAVVDKKLFEFLPQEMKTPMEQKAIHFADTNEQKNSKNLHLAFAFNPVSERFEIFLADYSGKLISTLKGNHALESKTWEFFVNPDSVLPQ